MLMVEIITEPSCMDPICLTLNSVTHPLQQAESMELAAGDVNFFGIFPKMHTHTHRYTVALRLYISVDMSADFDSLLWSVFLLCYLLSSLSSSLSVKQHRVSAHIKAHKACYYVFVEATLK